MRKEETEDRAVICHKCGTLLVDGDGEEVTEDIWFTAEESPTGEPICGECFDALPCNEYGGL